MRLRSILILVVVLAVTAVVYFATRPPEEPEEPPPDPVEYVWNIEDTDLKHITIELPQSDMSESFFKNAEDRQWYFDNEGGSQVNQERWGGGIPLLLSGPGAERSVAKGADEEQLAKFGFSQPLMKITLTKEDEEIIRIEVGDSTPDVHAYYVRLAESDNVYTVDYTWYDVLERLVTDPPYPVEEEAE